MKTIVFATDFSKGSRKAAETAAQIAIKTKAKLVLFHAFRYIIPYDSEISMLIVSSKELENASIKKLKRLKDKLLAIYPDEKKIEIQTREGLVVDALEQVLAETEAYLLVMGSVGDSPIGTKYFVSVSSTMINHSKVPMLLVPPKTKFSMYRNAILGLDFNFDIDTQILDKIIDFLRDLDVSVDLFTFFDDSEYTEKAALKIREALVLIPHTFTISKDKEFSKSVLSIAKNIHVDLLITLPKKHIFFEMLFVESNIQLLVLNDKLPILMVI